MDGASLMVFYYATANRVSPFVALIGRWPQRSAMMRSISGHGVYLCGRPATDEELALAQASARHASITWASLRDMLWTHRCEEELDKFYPILREAIRLHRWRIRQLAGMVAAKKHRHHHKRESERRIAAENRARQARAATAPQY